MPGLLFAWARALACVNVPAYVSELSLRAFEPCVCWEVWALTCEKEKWHVYVTRRSCRFWGKWFSWHAAPRNWLSLLCQEISRLCLAAGTRWEIVIVGNCRDLLVCFHGDKLVWGEMKRSRCPKLLESSMFSLQAKIYVAHSFVELDNWQQKLHDLGCTFWKTEQQKEKGWTSFPFWGLHWQTGNRILLENCRTLTVEH